MTRRPGGTALVAVVKAPPVPVDLERPLEVVASCRDQEQPVRAAREMPERVNVKKDTP